MEDCPRFKECGNADLKCHLCANFNQFKTGRSTGKGSHHERKVKQLRDTPTHLRPGSGAVPTSKGDLIDSQALYEAKSGYATLNARGTKSFTLQRHWLTKIESEALAEGRLPILAIHFDQAPDDEIWAVLRAEVLFDLLERIKELEAKCST